MLTDLANHLWQSTLVVGGVWCLALLLRRYRADVRHTLWLMASLKFLVPFSGLVALGRLVPMGTASPRVEEAVTVSAVAQRFSIEVLEPTVFRLARPVSESPAAAVDAITLPIAVLLGVWVVGTLIVVARWMVQWRRVSQARRRATTLVDGRVVAALREAEIAVRSLRRLPLMVSDASLEPGIVGIFRPVVLWPRGLSERLSEAQIEAILIHELAHVERRDNAKALVHMVVQALFWFHPVVWWIGARLIDERERACDEQVVRQGRERETYAQSILTTCTFAVEASVPCVSGVTGADLKGRIETIMRSQPGHAPTLLQRMALIGAATAVVTTPVVAGSLSAPRPFLKRITLVRDARERVGYTPLAFPQNPADRMAFDVASIHESTSGDGRVRILVQPGGRFTATNFYLRDLIRTAFQLQSDQLLGVPAELAQRRFDIVATAPGEIGPAVPGRVGPLQLMLQSLLEDRFGARMHRETRVVAAYALVRARQDGTLGPSLSASSVDCDALGQRTREAFQPVRRGQMAGERPVCGMRLVPGRLLAGGLPMSELARTLSDRLQRTVIDHTGLSGSYDVELTYMPDQLPAAFPFPTEPPSIDPTGPALTTALQEQLGLRIQSVRAPTDVLVVDQIALPTRD